MAPNSTTIGTTVNSATSTATEDTPTAALRAELGAVLWCDLDGEFLTPEGHVRLSCHLCFRWAIVRLEGVHFCGEHVSGTPTPEWLAVHRPAGERGQH